VNLLRFIPKRWHAIATELSKFGTIGVINLVVNFAVFNVLVLTFLRHGELKAKALATIVATTCAYVMNRHWTYRDRPKSTLHREYSLFFLFNLVGLVIEVSVVGAAKYGLHQTSIVVLNLCTAIGIMLGTVFRFWAYRTHVFKLAPEVVASAVAVPEPPPAQPVATAVNGSHGALASTPKAPVHKLSKPTTAKPLAAQTDPGAVGIR
jgi:putative flippase GtrA